VFGLGLSLVGREWAWPGRFSLGSLFSCTTSDYRTSHLTHTTHTHIPTVIGKKRGQGERKRWERSKRRWYRFVKVVSSVKLEKETRWVSFFFGPLLGDTSYPFFLRAVGWVSGDSFIIA